MHPRFFPSLAATIIACGSLYIFLYSLIIPAGLLNAGSGESGAVNKVALIALDENENDLQIRESLARIGSFISESSQEIMIDDFGSVRMIPLGSYREEIDARDPRDDGYADKLKSFFTHNGMRYFFLPLDGIVPVSLIEKLLPILRVSGLERQIRLLLGDIPFSFAILEKSGSIIPFFLVFIASCVAALLLSESKLLFICIVPVLLSLSLGGPSAFAQAALLAGIWELLRLPLGELSAARRYNRRINDYAGGGLAGALERLAPFRVNLALAFLLALIYLAYSIMLGFFPLPALAGLAGLVLFYFLAFRAKARKSRHVLFTPVLLPPYRAKTFSLFPLLLPFAAGALLSGLFPGGSFSGKEPLIDPDCLVSAADYMDHIAFQNSFSYRSLNVEGREPALEALKQNGYHRYYLGKDGLIEGNLAGAGWEMPGYPPFPLETLMGFLVDYSKGISVQPLAGGPSAFWQKGWIQTMAIMAACLLDLLRPGAAVKRRKKENGYGDKKIAA